MEKIGVVYGPLEYITDIWYISWPFGNLVAIWCTYFSIFWSTMSRKIWQPWLRPKT
jgi:hypothetical protein